MLGRQSFYRSASFQLENLGQNALTVIGNLCFGLFVIGVLIFTIIAATYEPEDPLFHPSTKLTAFLTSTSNATFKSDETVLKTGEDFIPTNQSAFGPTIDLADVVEIIETTSEAVVEPACDGPIDCRDREVFNSLMKYAIDNFKDIHFYKFGKPVPGDNESSCDLAWRFRPKESKKVSLYKDYRRFTISKSQNCTYAVESIGGYHSGVNARGRRRNQKSGFVPKGSEVVSSIPVIGENVNDSLPVVESEWKFGSGRYLIYAGSGDRCKTMNHYLWSFLCALGEAQYLKRTLVMDLSICLNKEYTYSRHDEEGKDFRFYFDFEHLKESASVLDQNQFWLDWGKWQKKQKLNLHVVEDFRTTPMKLANVNNVLIMRKFGTVEPDNYWYRVCEGETESVITRPWHLLWKSKRLMDIVSAISARLNWDFDSVHVERGEKARNIGLWPNLAVDTSPENLLLTLRDKIDDGRQLYIATNEPNLSFFDPLKDKYTIHFLQDFSDLWDENSEWYMETKRLNHGVPVEFDGYMKVEVDTEVFLHGKTQIETFNDLTSDCKDGINTCHLPS